MNIDKFIAKLTDKISKKVVEKIVGEDNRNIKEALIDLIIEVNADFINDSPSLSVCFPVPIEDNKHRILEYNFICKNKHAEWKIEDGLAILNFREKYKKGDREGCKIYFKIKSQAYESVHDYSNPKKFLNLGKYCILSDDMKKFCERFKAENARKIADKISTWIFLNLRYLNIEEMKSADWIFKNRFGNCVHYSTLFIAFCRYFEIPSRYVLGFVKYEKFEPHTWVEFYDEEIFSWIPVDLSLNQKFFVDATHIPISRFEEKQLRRYFKEVNLEIPKGYDEIFKIINFGTESIVEEDAHVEINVEGNILM